MSAGSGDGRTRIPWADLPFAIHEEVARLLGGPVIELIPQHGGYSPGSADRVVAANGKRAFVKAVGRDQNEHSIQIHRHEASVMAQLPDGVKAPRLLGIFDDDAWVALVLEDIDGRHPRVTSGMADASAVFEALQTLPEVRGSGITLPNVDDELANDFRAWRRLSGSGIAGLPTWVVKNCDRLEIASSRAADAVGGDHLVHLDLRADNVLIDGSGMAFIVDWPWAGVGAPWLDGLTYLLDGRLRGELFDTNDLLAQHPLFAAASTHDIDAVLAGLAGMFFERSAQPPPLNMPTLRQFQWDQAVAAVEWLEERWN
jgi:hypothetical protein